MLMLSVCGDVDEYVYVNVGVCMHGVVDVGVDV